MCKFKVNPKKEGVGENPILSEVYDDGNLYWYKNEGLRRDLADILANANEKRI